MGYTANQFCKISTGFYDANHNLYSYYHATDTLEVIEATGYFDDKAQYETVSVGDIFIVRGIDGTQNYLVSASSATEITILAQHQENLRTDYVTITAAEILLLRAAPKTLVAAPGAGKLLQFVDAQLILDWGTTGFTESSDNLAIKFTDGSGAAVSVTIEATGFIDQVADTITNAIAVLDTIVASASAANQALVLHNTGDGEYANAGDSTMTVAITYRILTTSL